MKSKILLFLLGIMFSISIWAQEGFNSVSEAGAIATEILKAADRKANFQIREANIPNAMAVLQNGKRYILYNPNFIDKLTAATGTRWAAISVLAHEIGHHLSTHIVNGKTVPMASELEADEFSGFVLRKMGASLEDAQAAMRTLASSRATKTHPARNDRLNSIAEGWNDADMNTSSDVYVKNEPIVEKRLPAINLNDILADISFHADPGADYHVTRRLNVIKVENNQLVRIGKLTKLNNIRYPYMIYDEKNNRVYIDNSGRIVNRRGELVGMMNSHH